MEEFNREVMFEHFDHPVPLLLLRDEAVGAEGDRIDVIKGAHLNCALAIGKLNSKGADMLLQALRKAMPKIASPLALVVWIAAVNRHPDHRSKSPREVYDGVMEGTIDPLDFMPVVVH